MLDLLVHNATLPDGRTGMSIAVQDGCIVEVAPSLQANAHDRLDAQGFLVTPHFVDQHFHHDAVAHLDVGELGALPVEHIDRRFAAGAQADLFAAAARRFVLDHP